MGEQPESAEDEIEGGENLTQKRMGEGEDKPVDANWDEKAWGETEDSPHEGEEGQQPV